MFFFFFFFKNNRNQVVIWYEKFKGPKLKEPPNTELDLCWAVGSSLIMSETKNCQFPFFEKVEHQRTTSSSSLKNKRTSGSFSLKNIRIKEPPVQVSVSNFF